MTIWEAFGYAAMGIFGFAAVIGLFFWTMNAWFDGEWWERIATLLVWTGFVAAVILAFSQVIPA